MSKDEQPKTDVIWPSSEPHVRSILLHKMSLPEDTRKALASVGIVAIEVSDMSDVQLTPVPLVISFEGEVLGATERLAIETIVEHNAKDGIGPKTRFGAKMLAALLKDPKTMTPHETLSDHDIEEQINALVIEDYAELDGDLALAAFRELLERRRASRTPQADDQLREVANHADIALQDALTGFGDDCHYDAVKFLASMRGNGYEIRRALAPPVDEAGKERGE